MGEFWLLSLDEIASVIDSYTARLEFDQKTELYMIYELAEVIGNRVALIFGDAGSVEPMRLEEVHPELFKPKDTDSEEEQEKQKAKEMAMAEQQALQFRAFADRWNPSLRKKYGDTQNNSCDSRNDEKLQQADGFCKEEVEGLARREGGVQTEGEGKSQGVSEDALDVREGIEGPSGMGSQNEDGNTES